MTSSAARVSVIIPTFNVERYLVECVDSCLAQRGNQVLEIIIAENNSTDQTPKIALQLAQSNPTLLKVVTCRKRGAGAARNAGLAVATGEWIQFLDADDLLLPDKLQHQLKLVEASTNSPSIVLASYRKRYANGRERIVRTLGDNPYLAVLWGHGRCGNTVSNLWKRSALSSVGGFDEQRASSQETNLIFSLLQAGAAVAWDDTPLCIIRQRPEGGQISTGSRDRLTSNFFELRREVILALNKSTPDVLRSNPHAAIMYRTFVDRLMTGSAHEEQVGHLRFILENFHMPIYQRILFSDSHRLTIERAVHWLAQRIPQRVSTLISR